MYNTRGMDLEMKLITTNTYFLHDMIHDVHTPDYYRTSSYGVQLISTLSQRSFTQYDLIIESHILHGKYKVIRNPLTSNFTSIMLLMPDSGYHHIAHVAHTSNWCQWISFASLCFKAAVRGRSINCCTVWLLHHRMWTKVSSWINAKAVALFKANDYRL